MTRLPRWILALPVLALCCMASTRCQGMPPAAGPGPGPRAAAGCSTAVLTAAAGSVGAGIQGTPVCLGRPAVPGRAYALPPVLIFNSGSGPETLTVRIRRLSPGRGRAVPPSWVGGTGQDVRLGPGQSARVPLTLTVPAGARPGRYLSDVVAYATAGTVAGHVNLAAGAATKLIFGVRR